MIIFILFIIITLAGQSLQCGVTTHNVIANRALFWHRFSQFSEYKTIVENNLDTFQAGAAFPDWGYNCILTPYISDLHEASETAHWLPFQKESIKYLRENYKKPWNNEAQRLIAFLLGVVSHSVSDIIWHDQSYAHHTKQGFMQAMANSNFNAQGNGYSHEVHNDADTGGEFMAAFQEDLSFIKDIWYLPVHDIIKIYNRMNFTNLNHAIIDTCTFELYSEVQAISKLPSEVLLTYYESKSPFLFDHYQDWWLGGVNDNAMWTSNCWNATINWIENGETSNYCYPLTGNYRKVSPNYRITSRKMIKSFVEKISKIKPPVDSKDFSCKMESDTRNLSKYVSDEKYASFGTSMATGDLNKDGYDDIVVGSPESNSRKGSVYIFYGNHKSSLKNPIRLNYNGRPNSRFGQSVQIVDLNLDGYDDLVVGIPGNNGLPSMIYGGELWIYFGSKNGINTKYPNIKFSSTNKYFNLGTSLNRGDLNHNGHDDLIVGIPYGYNKTNDWESGIIRNIMANKTLELDEYISSNEFWSWFGHKSEVINYRNNSYLITSEPMFNNGSDSIGRLLCYNISDWTNPNLVWEITGVDINGQMGLAFDVNINEGILVVSVPTKTDDFPQQGQVYALPIDQLFTKINHKLSELKIYKTFKGSNFYSRLGWDIIFGINKLYISEPYFGKVGAVHAISNDGEECITSNVVNSEYGKRILTLDFNGDSKEDLLISAPKDSTGATNAGSISLIY
jgi:glycosylphosphatidylinositol phospholipase D